MRIFSPRPTGLRERPRSLIDVELDDAQRAAVEDAAGSAMLVLGEAGHGKTTVALHRLAHLYRSAAAGRRFRAVVIVPHDGLVRLLQPLVTRLGAPVNVETYERWARRQARRAFLVTDHSKLGRPAPARIASLSEIDTVFTDQPLPRALAARCADWGTTVRLCPP